MATLPPALHTGDAREDRRRTLALAILEAIGKPGGERLSFRAMAAAVGVTRPTLRHHFGDETGAIQAALELASELGTFYLDLVERAEGPPRQVLPRLVRMYVLGWERGELAQLHHVGMRVGLAHADLGRTYADKLLGRTIEAYGRLIARWHAEGRVTVDDPHTAALSLLGPVQLLLMMRHNLASVDGLDGLEPDALIDALMHDFFALHGAEP